MCNGQPVEIGVSSIQVEAEVAANPTKLTIASEEDAALLADTFDVGLVTVEVTATILDELKTDDGMVFRRLSVQELITEINGEKVVQTEAGQQILDVFDNGSLIKWNVDPLTGFMLPGPAMIEDNNDASMHVVGNNQPLSAVDAWWNETSTVVRSVVCTTVFAFFFAICYIVSQLFTSRSASYEAVAVVDHDDNKQQPPAYIEKEETQPFILSEEKK